MSRSVSPAVLQLLRDLERHGLTASAAQLERWAGAGLLEPAERTRGGRHGTDSYYSPDVQAITTRRVRVLLEVTGRGKLPLELAALSLFARDVPVPDETLRAAYRAWLRRNEQKIPACPDGDELDRAEAAAKAAVCQRDRGAATAAFHVQLTGEAHHDDGLAELLEMNGDRSVAAFASAYSSNADRDEALKPVLGLLQSRILAGFSLIALKAETAAIPIVDLSRARDQLRGAPVRDIDLTIFAFLLAVLRRRLLVSERARLDARLSELTHALASSH
jgi:hypothetical protein